jgi:hypothetical protein
MEARQFPRWCEMRTPILERENRRHLHGDLTFRMLVKP